LAKAIQSHTLGGTVRMAENQLTTYVAALVASSRITSSVRDPFIIRKFHQKIYNLVEANHGFITQLASSSLGGPVVLRQQHLLSCIDVLIDLIEYEEHLKRSDLVVLAYAQRALLRFRLFIQRTKIQATSQIQPASAAKEPEIKKKKIEISENKKKILTFIRQSPARTKEIVDEFRLMSSRTVIRSLKELMTAGLVKKKTNDRGAVYLIAG